MAQKTRLPAFLLSVALLCTLLPAGMLNVSSETAGDFKYTPFSSEVRITEYIGSDDEVVIPATLDDKPVTVIDGGAFKGCTSLTSVTIPNSVTEIGGNAFYDCTSLTSITIPDSVTRIGGEAFENCSALASITIPDSVTSIGTSAFFNTAYYNEKENWSNDVLYLGSWLIEAAEGVTTYTTEAGTTAIADRAFSRCPFLKSITVSDGVTVIGEEAFFNCTSLTRISLPNSLTTIGGHAFANCSALRSIVIPQSVTEIGRYAFSRCTSLTTTILLNSKTTIGFDAFYQCFKAILCGESGSTAHEYALQGNIPFRETLSLGDVNEDSKVNTTDARQILKYAAGIITSADLDLNVADVTFDGDVNTTDARTILQFVAGPRLPDFPSA